MAYSETHISVLLAEAGAVWRGLKQGVQVHRNENNGLKQQAPQPIKNSPCFAGFLSQSVRAYICGFLCACAAGPGGGEWGAFQGGSKNMSTYFKWQLQRKPSEVLQHTFGSSYNNF